MTIMGDEGWKNLEAKAYAAEHPDLAHIETPKVPAPTVAQQLAWAVIDLANCKASIHRKNSAISEALMYLSIGQYDRAQQVLSRAFIDL